MVAKTLSRALALLLVSSPAAFGLGLGDIRLRSSLNAPLDAEIELVGATAEELAGLKTQLASRETFARYGLDWPAFLSGVAVQVTRAADGRDIIRLTSVEAITEPFVNLLVEVNWARGKLVREYTMLLDPPVFTPGQAAGAGAPVAAPQIADSARAGAISRAAEPAEQAVAAEPPVSAALAAPAADSAAAGSTRIVQRGDTLSRIAGEIATGDPRASRRWMVAIYRSNPRAFDGNMNILRSGAELQIPDTSAAEGISTSEATAEIRQQHTAWRGAASPAAADADEPGSLRLVPPAADAAASGAAGSGPGAAAAQGRVRELEAQLLESRRLLELRNAEVAQLQARLAAAQGATPAAPGEEQPMEPAPALVPEPQPEAPVTAEAQPPAEPAGPAVSEPAPDVSAPTAAAAEAEGVSLVDRIKEFWWAGAALLVAILALLGLKAWRSRQQNEFDDSLGRLASGGGERDFSGDTAPIRSIGPEPGFLVEETGTHERPRFGGGAGEIAVAPPNVASDDTISSETAINLDQGDPLAEADFHMAYGLYDQAADLVRIAISREPERRDLKLKLLEVFFVWGNKEQFLLAARELAGTRAEAAPGEWEKIVIMGKQLAPDDELFSGGGGTSSAAAGGVDLDLEGGESRVDFDLMGEPLPGEPDDGMVDLDIGSALGDKDATAESPTRTTDAHLALHEGDLDDPASATTREMTAREPTADPDELMPDFNLDDSEEAPTVEQPAMPGQDHPTIRQKVDVAMRQDRGDQTAELAIDDLGLDLSALDTIDQPGLGASTDAPTLVAGLDDRSRRVMADAERGAGAADDAGAAATGAWRVRPEDLDPTMPPTQVQALEGDISATSRMTVISEQEIDFDFDAVEGGGKDGIDLDVGTATLPDSGYTATQRISSEDLALPDLEPATMSEVGTKLDLARAYMDMGDPEGARNILDEVLQEGSVTQKQEAQRLIDSLPG